MRRAARLFGATAAVATLVLLMAVSGAFADGIRNNGREGLLVKSEAMQSWSNPAAALHADFGLDHNGRFDGIRNGRVLHMSLFEGKFSNDVADTDDNNDDPTSTPEPGTLLLLAAGAGIVFLARERWATES